ncbi:16S rRNA processing protein RimM [Natranaerovirga pectinivora]|uniref:Ribosome maturation factor RimM n=1 Tax=Natranaerovirga pectinivora TaxID=682400 RepID=A0A4R3MRZ1_9FIRM|nr:ribosome maturation factor RimM [Natranaerovirga pectinivora]TCT16978.1 16S rRNA processing protein RimM [Natranaerovirga pectinivora]
MIEYFQIGIIANTHGIKGEIKVLPTTDDPKRFELLDKVFVDTGKITKEFEIETVRYSKQFVLLKFKGVNSINDIEYLKSSTIKIPRDMALPLEEDEYYISDLIGLEVITDEGNSIGKIKDVLITGSNEVYIVENEDRKQILLPAIKECILNVDIANNTMKVHIMKGLID